MKKIGLLIGLCFISSATWAQVPSFADLAEKLLPSVVNISTSVIQEEQDEDKAPETETLGSGFIISADGYIVTNQHVIDKAQIINVILQNNEKYEAQIIGEDKLTDLALLKITTDIPLTSAVFGDSDTLRVGDWVLAIGNPFGLGGSVTAGIVSAKSRDIESGAYDNFIQTDASINQGNSGGPMFNMQGEVIGVNTAIFSSTGNSMGVGFATPSKMTEWVISQLRQTGKVTRGWIGISIKPTTPPENGILVTRVNEGSPAQKAGFLAGDIITKFNTLPITSTTNLSRIIAESAIDERLNFEITRHGENLILSVRTEEMPEPEDENKGPLLENETVDQPAERQNTPLGLEIQNISQELLEKYNLPQESKGVVVTQIDSQSDASIKGLQVGDLITKVDKKEVLDTAGFNDYIATAQNENNRPVLLTIQNAETEHFIAVKLR